MVSPKSRNAETVPCDYCSEQIAVLFCRADSAKLCLLCDQHVHSANALSRKHIRSQICDNCSSEPVSVRCVTDNLVLCQECDWDAHGSCSVSASHDRNPVEGFSGCPSPLELASIWGFDLDDKKLHQSSPSMVNWSSQEPVDSWMYKSTVMTLHDLMVPSENPMIFSNVPHGEMVAASKRQNLSCGKDKNVIYKQLVELMKKDVVGGDVGGGGGGGGGENLVPGTPNGNTWQGNVEETFGLGNESEGLNGVMDISQQSLQHQSSFTSLLMLPTQVDSKQDDHIAQGEILWDSNPNDQATQIWDFNLGTLRDPEESGPIEVGFGGSDAGFMIKNYDEVIKEPSLTTMKVSGEMYRMNCSMAHEDLKSFTNDPNNPMANQGPATSESNNISKARPSSASIFIKTEGNVGSKDFQFTEQSILVRGESTRTPPMTRADMELLAQNRGNAMLRYKEKKKNRRYDKHIRYESRKARADTRKRVKGRFVKATEAPTG